MKLYIILFLLSLLLWLPSRSQDQVAVPKIINYSNEVYHAGIQNWDVEQDTHGNIYFGNNEGLLVYNGKFWNRLRLPNLTAVRSVEIDAKNRIFVGGQDELGYFYPDQYGTLKYNSLIPQLPENLRKLADVWNIAVMGSEVFFRSSSLIVHYKDDLVKTYQPVRKWGYMGKAGKHLFAVSAGDGLMVYDKEIWKPFNNNEVFKTRSVTSILPFRGDTLLVSTLKNGFFLMINDQLIPTQFLPDDVFKNERIYTVKRINDGNFAVGTASGGVFILNKDGKLVQRFAYKNGLQSNNVRGLLSDNHKNLWLALDDGIDLIAINSAIKKISPDKNKQVTSYAFRKFKDKLYIGTGTGLYASDINSKLQDLSLSTANFQEVPDTKGQVWNLDEVNGKVVMGHEDGAFSIENTSASRLYFLPGTWVFEPFSNVFPSRQVISGTYEGLQLMNFNNGVYSNTLKISGLKESLRFIVTDNNFIWSSHPSHGIYRIQLKPGNKEIASYALYGVKNGLPSNLYNYVYHIKNRLLAATEDGIYEFDYYTNKFKSFELMNHALDKVPVQYLKEDTKGNIWFVSNKRVGVVDFSLSDAKHPFTINYLSEMDGKIVGGFECIYPLDEENIFIGASKGAFHVNYKKYITNITRPQVKIGAVKLFGKSDSVIFGGFFMNEGRIVDQQPETQVLSLSSDFNSVHFEFASALFSQSKNIEYSYMLEGFDKQWSAWVFKNEKDYTNLPSGRYKFKVRARLGVSAPSDIASYTFVINPPWYGTFWMYIIYILAACYLIYVGFKYQRKKHISAQQKLSYLHQLELEHSEKEIVRLRYEKLETEVHYKNKELSTMTMHLVQRGKVLAKIKEVISMVLKNNDISDISPSFRHLVRLIRDVEKGDQELEHLSMHFNNVNTDFFNKLKDQFPELTPNDLKFCAYLRMNISSKEIAQLMNITSKAVEVGRYRLRKKLQLSSDVNLYDFLTKVARENPA